MHTRGCVGARSTNSDARRTPCRLASPKDPAQKLPCQHRRHRSRGHLLLVKVERLFVGRERGPQLVADAVEQWIRETAMIISMMRGGK